MNSIAVALNQRLTEIYRGESRKIYATLVRLLGDMDLAEEALQEAFSAAASIWARDGVPEKPTAWLISTGKNKAIDELRKRGRLEKHKEELLRQYDALHETRNATGSIEDDRLRLIFTCCHPAIDSNIRVALTLREICGLTTEQISAAFLVPQATMAQRLVRGKAKIRAAAIPICIPDADELPERIDAVLKVVYLVFNEGYYASSGTEGRVIELAEEAIRLCRLLAELLPEPEVLLQLPLCPSTTATCASVKASGRQISDRACGAASEQRNQILIVSAFLEDQVLNTAEALASQMGGAWEVRPLFDLKPLAAKIN